jgi:hypothetical protein
LFTWSNGEKLSDLRKPERVAQIRADAAKRAAAQNGKVKNMRLVDVFRREFEQDPEFEEGCLVCSV